MRTRQNDRRDWATVVLRRALVTIAIFLTFPPEFSLSQNLPFQQISTSDGLLSDGITALYQDSRGFLWIGTAEGLIRYDGLGFSSFRTTDGLPMNFITCITESGSEPGSLWIGTMNGGVAKWSHGQFRSYLHDSSNYVRTINGLCEDERGALWIATSGGLFTLEHEQIEPFMGNELRSVEGPIRESPDGGIWIGVGSSVLIVRDNHIIRELANVGRPGHGKILCLAFDASGHGWAGTSDSALVQIADTGIVRRIHLPASPNAIVMDGAGDVRATSAIGLISLRQTSAGGWSITHTGRKNGLPTEALTECLYDREQNLWLGTQGKGLLRVGENPVQSYPNGSLPGNVLYTPAACSPGENHAWFIVRDGLGELYRGPDSAWHYAEQKFSRAGKWRQPSGLRIIADGKVWISFVDSGLACYQRSIDASGPTAYRITRELRSIPGGSRSKKLLTWTEENGIFWLSFVDEGVFKLSFAREPRVLAHYTTADGLPDEVVRAIFRDSQGNLWFGGDNGGCALLRNEGTARQTLTRYTVSDGLADGHVRSFLDDGEGRVWIGTRDGGISVFENGVFSSYSLRNGLLSNTVWSLTLGSGNTLWLGTALGMQRFDRIRRVPLWTEPSLRGPPVIACGMLGRSELWMATTESFRVFDDRRSISASVLPLTHLTGMQVNGRMCDLGSRLDFSYDHNSCIIDYVGIWFSDQSGVRYVYRLTDAMKEWSLPTDHHSVSFAGLEPGHYRFEVRAMNGDGRMSTEPASIDFTIHPPFWQTWWLRSIAILALSFTVYGFYRYRMNKIMELAETRNRIARDLHDEVGGSLASISFFAEALRSEMNGAGAPAATRFLNLIAESSASARSAMRDIVWSLNADNDSWERYAARLRRYAADLLESRKIGYTVDIAQVGPSPGLSLEQRKNLWLIYKEIIVNAVKHADCTKMSITLKIAPKKMTLEVRDNGKGLLEGDSREGSGMRNIPARAALLGGTARVDSSLEEGTRWVVEWDV